MVNSVVLGLTRGVRRTEIPLLPHDFLEGTSPIGRPSHGEFLHAFSFGLLEFNRDASEPLRLVKDQPNRLDTRLSRAPASLIGSQSADSIGKDLSSDVISTDAVFSKPSHPCSEGRV